jgi:hypothetical protein
MSGAQTAWAEHARRMREIAELLDTPHADKSLPLARTGVYVAREYTKADLRRDLLASIPIGYGV